MFAVAIIVCATLFGCGTGKMLTQVIYGDVTCGGEKVDCGRVAFVPIDGTPGTTHTAVIVDGQYQIDNRSGVPLGKHRIEIDARKKTGRKVKGFDGMEQTMIDETVRMGPEIYAGKQSPLAIEITADSDGRYDIELPPQ